MIWESAENDNVVRTSVKGGSYLVQRQENTVRGIENEVLVKVVPLVEVVRVNIFAPDTPDDGAAHVGQPDFVVRPLSRPANKANLHEVLEQHAHSECE